MPGNRMDNALSPISPVPTPPFIDWPHPTTRLVGELLFDPHS